MSSRTRILVALFVGCAAFVLCYVQLERRDQLAADFTWIWRGARELLEGRNPYDDPSIGKGRGLPYPHNAPLFYPLPAVLIGVPFAALPAQLAGALFFGLSSTLLAYGLSREGLTRFPLFLSATFWVSCSSAQWGPFIMAAAVLPLLMSFSFAKPNLGLAVMFAYPHRRGLLLAIVVILISLVILPTWPADWLENLGDNHHIPPIALLPGGLLLLLAVLAIRKPSGRLLTMLAVMPQLIWWNDPLVLWLVPKTMRQSLFITATSWIGYLGWYMRHGTEPTSVGIPASPPWVLLSVYFPVLMLVLWQESGYMLALRGVPRRLLAQIQR